MEEYKKYIKKMYKVRGWFSEESAKLFALLLTIQRNHELNGDILEFGVYHGKSAILLGYFLYSNDKLVVNDIFESQHLNISLSGGTYHPPSIDKFTSNYKKFHANISNLTIYSCSSDQIKNVDVNPRFIHIDAGHSFEELRTDLLNSIALATRTNFSYSRDPGKLIDFPSQIVHGSTVRFEGEPCSG
jgi:hypothetical protein